MTMLSDPSKKTNRSVSPRRKRPDEPRLDPSLYSAESYLNRLAEIQKASKSKVTWNGDD